MRKEREKLKEVNEKYSKEIYLNVLKAVILVLYFFVLNLAYANVSTNNFEIGIKIVTMLFLFISIYIIEKAYKKDDGNLAIQGIEILVLATYTLTSRHITNKFDFEFKTYSLVASYIFAIYFILKCIIIYTKGRKEVVQNLSDIREIVKKEEPVKKEAVKKSEKKKQEKSDKEKEVEDKSENKKVKTENSTNAENKKSTTKKTNTANKKNVTKKTTTNEKNTSKKTTMVNKKTTQAKKEDETKNNGNTKNNTTKKTETKKTTTSKEKSKQDKETKDKKKTTKKKSEEVKEND